MLQDRLCQGSVPTLTSRCPLQAYRQLAKSHHPDKPGGSAARFAKIQDAFATLADPKKRLVYDTWARELRFRYIDAQRVSLNQLPERLPAASMLRLTCHQDQHEALGYLRYEGGIWSRLQGVRMCCSMPLPSQAYTATRSPSWWSPVRSAGGLPPRSAGRAACRSASSAPSSATGRCALQLCVRLSSAMALCIHESGLRKRAAAAERFSQLCHAHTKIVTIDRVTFRCTGRSSTPLTCAPSWPSRSSRRRSSRMHTGASLAMTADSQPDHALLCGCMGAVLHLSKPRY